MPKKKVKSPKFTMDEIMDYVKQRMDEGASKYVILNEMTDMFHISYDEAFDYYNGCLY